MNKLKGYGPFILRLVLGPIFILHGWDKVVGMYGYFIQGAEWGFVGMVAGLRYVPTWPPLFWAVCATLAEFFGGVLILLGLKIRPAAALIGVVMIVAIVGFHLPAGDSVEKQLALLAMACSLIASGAGRWSVKVKQ
jgi:putative oxidoreductase